MNAVHNGNPSKCQAGRSVSFPSLRCLILTNQLSCCSVFLSHNHRKKIARRAHKFLWSIIFAGMMYSCQRFVYVCYSQNTSVTDTTSFLVVHANSLLTLGGLFFSYIYLLVLLCDQTNIDTYICEENQLLRLCAGCASAILL